MIYLPNNRTTILNIPRLSTKYASADTLRLVSTIDLSPIRVPVEIWSVSKLYITVSANMPDLQVGEYQYELLHGENVVSYGLAIVYGNKENNIAYGENEEYIQYQ